MSITLNLDGNFHIDSSTNATVFAYDDADDELIGTIDIDFSSNKHVIKLDFCEDIAHGVQARLLQGASDMLDSFFGEGDAMPSMTIEL